MSAPVIWFLGLAGSGKTTLARVMRDRLTSSSPFPDVERWDLLDGDEIRAFLGPSVGYSSSDRRISVSVMGLLAWRLSENGVGVVVANISPFQDLRRMFRRVIPRYHEIHCRCSLAECIRRHPKDLYRGRSGSERKDLVGVDIPFEEPEHPDLVIDTERSSVGECVAAIETFLARAAAGIRA